MPYDITTKDGITLRNIPDDVAPDSPQLKARVEKIRGGNTSAAKSSIFGSITQGAGDLAAGALRGAGSIGATILAPADIINAAIEGKGLTLDNNRQRRADMDAGLQAMGANPDSLLYKGGKLGGEIAGTAGAGGVLANGVRAIPALAKFAPGLASAIESGGFSLGNAPGATTAAELVRNIATRLGGGAVAGGAAAGMINPSEAGTGAVIGAAMPVVGKVAGELGRGAKAAFIDPLINKDKIVAGAIQRAVGPANIQQVVAGLNQAPKTPGVRFSAGEASGNPSLAAIEDAFRATNPGGALNAQAQANRSALAQPVRDLAQDELARAAAEQARKETAAKLYGEALAPNNAQDLTPWLKGQITQLLKRPSINQASKDAQRFAMERGEKPSPNGSLQALHDVKTALDDMISKAVAEGQGGQAKALGETKAQLLTVMEKLSPGYQAARTTYADMSKPINQMDVGKLLSEKLLPATSGDVPASINAATFARALQNPDQVAKLATGFKAAKLEDVLTPDQLKSIMGVNADASRLAEVHKLGAGQGSATARRQAMGSFIGDHFAEQAPAINRILEALGNVPGTNYLTRGASGIGNMLGSKINSGMSQQLEAMLASDPQGVQNALLKALAQGNRAGNPMLEQLLRTAPVAYRASQATP